MKRKKLIKKLEQMGCGMMKITQVWDLFYHLESVPKIKDQVIWCQVSGVRIWRIQIGDI